MPLASSLATASEGHRKRIRLRSRRCRASASQRDYDVERFGVCVIRAQPMPVSSPSLFMRAPDDTITRCRERCDIYVDTATQACTRRGRPEMARPCRPSVRTFFRALLQRAVEALLQRGAIHLSYGRGYPIE